MAGRVDRTVAFQNAHFLSPPARFFFFFQAQGITGTGSPTLPVS